MLTDQEAQSCRQETNAYHLQGPPPVITATNESPFQRLHSLPRQQQLGTKFSHTHERAHKETFSIQQLPPPMRFEIRDIHLGVSVSSLIFQKGGQTVPKLHKPVNCSSLEGLTSGRLLRSAVGHVRLVPGLTHYTLPRWCPLVSSSTQRGSISMNHDKAINNFCSINFLARQNDLSFNQDFLSLKP